MLVQPAALRADLTQAVARITRVTLADLLGNLGGNARDQQAFADLLRSSAPLTARVLETRADGVSVLELVSTRVAIRLASAHAPGDLLTIVLDDAAGDTAPRAAAAAAVKLSAPALLISDIQKSDLNQIYSETVSTEPVTHKAAPPHALAHALQQAVRQSGLFYESHLRGWVDGRIALESVQQEPQARVAESPSQLAGEARETVHPQLEPLLRQQLETLERQSIVWRGCLWPGQQAEIEISGEPQAAADTEVPRAWHVRLNLDAPALGPVRADIALTGRQLDVRLQGAGTAKQVLRQERTVLSQALAAHGLDVRPIQVTDAAP